MTSAHEGRPSARELLIWGTLGLVMLSLVGLSLWRHDASAPLAPPPILGQLPDFALVASDGRAVTGADLAGAPFIADFVFTRCVGICPRLSARMKEVLATLPADGSLRAVTITVDPEHDTPEVLAEYAARFDAPPRWLFLTGERDAVYTLIRDGFKLALEPSPTPEQALAGEQILHSNRFVLVDGEGRVRGYYDSFDDEAVDRLRADVAALLAAS